MAKKHIVDELDDLAQGRSLVASICAEAADRIRRQDARIVKLKKECQRRRLALETLQNQRTVK